MCISTVGYKRVNYQGQKVMLDAERDNSISVGNGGGTIYSYRGHLIVVRHEVKGQRYCRACALLAGKGSQIRLSARLKARSWLNAFTGCSLGRVTNVR